MVDKAYMDDLKHRFSTVETETERNEIWPAVCAAVEQHPEEIAAITLAQIKETNERAQDELIRNRLKPVLAAISLSYIAKVYFHKSRSWLAQRVNGNRVNGAEAKFTTAELKILDLALKDLAAKLLSIDVL